MYLTNHLSCLLLIWLISIFFIRCEEEKHIEDCVNLKPFRSFRSHLKFKFTRPSTTGGEPTVEEYLIKETFHRNKGKLEVESLDKKIRKIHIFDFDKKRIFTQDLMSNSCESDPIEEKNQKSVGKYVFWDSKTNVAGATAIFNQLANDHKTPKEEDIQKIRGLNALRCYFETTKKIGLIRKKVIKEHELFILKDFRRDAEPLLRLTYSDHQTVMRPLFYELDYFKLQALDDDQELDFESDDELANNDFWFIPDYCLEKGDEESQPWKPVHLPSKYELTLHKLKDGRSRTLVLISDEKERLIALSGWRSTEKVVLDLRSGVQYEFGVSSCHKHFNGHYRDLEQYADLLEIRHKLRRIAPTDYIGRRACREMDCDAYSFYAVADRLEDVLRGEGEDREGRRVKEDRKSRDIRGIRDSRQERDIREDREHKESIEARRKKEAANSNGDKNDNDVGQDASTLYTFYLREDGSFQQLVQVKKQQFARGTNKETKQLMQTTVYDVYGFKSLESDDPRHRTIDLTQCVYEDEHRTEIRMTALAKQATQFKNDLSVENDTLIKIKEITKLDDHNLPRIEKLINENSLTVALTLIQPINDLVYFDTFDRYAIPLVHLSEQFNRTLEHECATMGKKNADWVGFQHCGGSVCYPIRNAGQFELSDVNNTDYEKQCRTMRKRDLETSGRYIELPDAVELIERSVEDGKFELPNAKLTFQRLENEQEFNQIDRTELFELVRAGSCLDTEKLKDSLKCNSKPKATDCLLTCQSSNCNVYSVRRVSADQFDCCFAERTFEELQEQHGADGFLRPDESCNVYELSYLNKFNRWSGKTLVARPEHSLLMDSPEECAIECLKENVWCRSFSFCHSDGAYHCELRSYNPHGNSPAKLIDSNHCTLYSANFLVDYHKTEFDKLTNFSVTADLSLQDCAKQCNENGEECSRFEFCQDKGAIACLLETGQRGHTDHPIDMVCTSYRKNKCLIMDDLVPSQPVEEEHEEPSNDNSVYAYVVFFFVLGLATGALALFGRRVGACGPRRRFCGRYYIKFVQDEDAISIRERIEARKFSEEEVNQSQRESKSSRSDVESEESATNRLATSQPAMNQPAMSQPTTSRPASIQQTETENAMQAISRSSSKTDDHHQASMQHQAFGNELNSSL